MGKAVKSAIKGVGGVFGLSGSATYKPQTMNKSYFDIAKEVKPAQEQYQAALERQQGLVSAIAPMQKDVLTQMGRAALGQGPSLAEAQLRSAQDRNLAQQLAASQAARGGGALGQRALLQNMAASGQELAQQSAIERLKEREAFANQAGIAESGLRGDITERLNLELMPKQSMQAWEQARVGAANEAALLQARQNQIGRGQLLGGITQGITKLMGQGAGGAETVAKKDGGHITGPGTGTSDSIPARLSDGEFVVKSSVVKKPGILEFLTKLNDGEIDMKAKGYKKGGKVEDESPKATTVIPDKGWGKIIIVGDKRKDEEPVKYASGGRVSMEDVAKARLAKAADTRVLSEGERKSMLNPQMKEDDSPAKSITSLATAIAKKKKTPTEEKPKEYTTDVNLRGPKRDMDGYMRAADGGLIKERTSLAGALSESDRQLIESHKQKIMDRPDVDSEEKKQKLIRELEKMYLKGPQKKK